MQFLVEAMNTELVQKKFTRMGSMAVDAHPVLDELADFMMGVVDINFQSQGRRGGGSWKQLTQEWLQRKMREGKDPRIGHYTGALRASLTVRGAEHQRIENNGQWVRLDSMLDYSYKQNRERPFTKFLPQDRLIMRTMLTDYLISAWRDLPAFRRGVGRRAWRELS